MKDHPTTFLIGIGGALQSGKPHDGRAPDYDDWTLNGDILLWDDLLGRAIELSSMGIRVDAAALDRQLKPPAATAAGNSPSTSCCWRTSSPSPSAAASASPVCPCSCWARPHWRGPGIHLGRRDHPDLP